MKYINFQTIRDVAGPINNTIPYQWVIKKQKVGFEIQHYSTAFCLKIISSHTCH
jgi:hypothetical protein